MFVTGWGLDARARARAGEDEDDVSGDENHGIKRNTNRIL